MTTINWFHVINRYGDNWATFNTLAPHLFPGEIYGVYPVEVPVWFAEMVSMIQTRQDDVYCREQLSRLKLDRNPEVNNEPLSAL
jgi:hypothetical protein